MTREHDPFADLRQDTPDELAGAIAVYGFRDPLGHPLEGCAEYQELVRRSTEGAPAIPAAAIQAA